MMLQIKHRIEQIKRGEVPEGYKKTKVGIVPEEWEIKHLSDVLKKQTKKNIDNSIHNVLTNSATQGIISQTSYFDKQIANDENTNGYYVVESGYFVYNPRISVSAPCGPFNKYYGFQKGIMSPLYTVYKYCDKSPFYSEFLSYYYGSSNWYKYMNSIANYGARSDRMNVTSDDMDAMPLPYPPLDEQKQIVKILACQDKIIELNKRKIEELKKLKKAYLSKMFPKKGCDVPELRFKDFTAPWEYHKLKKYLYKADERNKDEKYTQDDVLAASLGNELEKKHIFFGLRSTAESVKTYRVVKSRDIIYTKSPIKGASNGIVRASKGIEGIVPSLYCVYHSVNYINSSVIQSYFEDKTRLDNYLYPLVNVGARNNVNITDSGFLEGTITIPVSIEEQNRIVELLDSITINIALHQRKAEELQNEKKALMQLLLTGIVRA